MLGVQQASFNWLSIVFTEARIDPKHKTIWKMIWKWQPVVKMQQDISFNMEQLNYPKKPFREARRSGHPMVTHKLNANMSTINLEVGTKTGVHPCNYCKTDIDKTDRKSVV